MGSPVQKFSDADKNEIRTRNELVKYAMQHTTLKLKAGEYWGTCPFHKEKTPSFSVHPGKQIFHCHGCGAGGDIFNFVRKERDCSFGQAIHFLAERCGYKAAPLAKKEVIYNYLDENSDLLFQVIRMAGEKDFRQRRPDGVGGWLWKTKGMRRVVYRLPEILQAIELREPVFVVEGEKDADRLVESGLVATTSPGGAGKWKHEYAQPFQGAHVRILADNDEPGKDHAFAVAESLQSIASSVKVVLLPGLPPKGDVSDWLDLGNNCEDLIEEVKHTPIWDGRKAFPDDDLSNIGSEQSKANLDSKAPATDWQSKLVAFYTKKGDRIVKKVDYNLALILQNDEGIAGCLGFDDFRQDVVCLTDPPWNKPGFVEDLGRTELFTPWQGSDYHRLKCWVQATWDLNFASQTVIETVLTASQQRSFHPVKEYLNGLVWDKVSRIDNWLTQYLSATSDPDYLKIIGPKFFLAAVARIFAPGCKADNVLILEGGQGVGKSTVLRVLASDEWFADTPFQISNKDAYLGLEGRWIIELAELDSLMKAENSEAKAFFTSATDRYRKPYARTVQDFPRQCIFAGTVNHTDYLRDETGARRYWPVACGSVDIAMLRQDRDQLWAEAVHRYRQGERWHLLPEESDIAFSEQEQRATDDPWEEPIAIWLNEPGRRSDENVTVSDILSGAIGLTTDKMNRSHQTRVGRIMTRRGWKRDRKRIDGVPTTLYLRPSI